MRFKRVNYKNLRLRPGDKISPSYIRLVEKDSKLHQMAQKKSKSAVTDESSQESVAKKENKMDYTIIATNSWNIDIATIELEEQVKEHIKEGWRPLGGACLSSTKYSGFCEHFMTQTMIREIAD